MKKFVGKVNGVTYNNIKDFQTAAEKALSIDGEMCCITSYYEDVKSTTLNTKDLQPNETYEVPKILIDSVNTIDNYDEVVKFISENIRNSKNKFQSLIEENVKLNKQISDNKTQIESLTKTHNYYNSLLNYISNDDTCECGDCCCKDNCDSTCNCSKEKCKCTSCENDKTCEDTKTYENSVSDILKIFDNFGDYLKDINFF